MVPLKPLMGVACTVKLQVAVLLAGRAAYIGLLPVTGRIIESKTVMVKSGTAMIYVPEKTLLSSHPA